MIKYMLAGIFLAYLIHAILTWPEDRTIAVIQMDGVGWFRVTNFMIDSEKCVNFTDGAGEKIKFCGAYGITERSDFHTLDSKPKR